MAFARVLDLVREDGTSKRAVMTMFRPGTPSCLSAAGFDLPPQAAVWPRLNIPIDDVSVIYLCWRA